MIEDAVQNYPNPQLSGLGAQGAEVLFRTQHGVDFGVVRRVVAVVGGGLEDGAEVQGGYAQVRQIGELGGDARQRAAEEIPVPHLPVRIGPPLRRIGPVLMDPAVSHHAGGVWEGETAEAVRKNLVGYAGPKPLGREGFLVNRQLPGLHPTIGAVAGGVQDAAGAVIPPEAEVVPDQIRL